VKVLLIEDTHTLASWEKLKLKNIHILVQEIKQNHNVDRLVQQL